MARARSSPASSTSTASLGFEAKLWLAANKLRNNRDAAGHKHAGLQWAKADDIPNIDRTYFKVFDPLFDFIKSKCAPQTAAATVVT